VNLLRFFSVNLRVALTASVGVTARTNAVFVPEALEFFAFGKAAGAGVTVCKPTS
jgi:hypothetical protein